MRNVSKPGLVVALGLGKPKAKAKMDEEPAEKPEMPSSGEDGDSDSTAGAQGVMDAVKSGDVEALEMALKLFVKSCNYDEE